LGITDTQGAARLLAAAITKIGGVDMAMFGRQTLDDGSGLTAAQTARILGWPILGFVGSIQHEAGKLQVTRIIEEGRQTVGAPLPAVLSIVQSIGEPRYPSFIGIRKAAKADIQIWSLADLDSSAPVPVVSRINIITPPHKEVTCEIIGGESPAAIAQTLADSILAEKIL